MDSASVLREEVGKQNIFLEDQVRRLQTELARYQGSDAKEYVSPLMLSYDRALQELLHCLEENKKEFDMVQDQCKSLIEENADLQREGVSRSVTDERRHTRNDDDLLRENELLRKQRASLQLECQKLVVSKTESTRDVLLLRGELERLREEVADMESTCRDLDTALQECIVQKSMNSERMSTETAAEIAGYKRSLTELEARCKDYAFQVHNEVEERKVFAVQHTALASQYQSGLAERKLLLEKLTAAEGELVRWTEKEARESERVKRAEEKVVETELERDAAIERESASRAQVGRLSSQLRLYQESGTMFDAKEVAKGRIDRLWKHVGDLSVKCRELLQKAERCEKEKESLEALKRQLIIHGALGTTKLSEMVDDLVQQVVSTQADLISERSSRVRLEKENLSLQDSFQRELASKEISISDMSRSLSVANEHVQELEQNVTVLGHRDRFVSEMSSGGDMKLSTLETSVEKLVRERSSLKRSLRTAQNHAHVLAQEGVDAKRRADRAAREVSSILELNERLLEENRRLLAETDRLRRRKGIL